MNIRPGMTVARYRILKEVGEGAFATVYRAYDAQHRRYVALKVLKSEHHEESEMAQRFRREVAAALRLAGHPHIVNVFALGQLDRMLYIAMEFIEGASLTEWLVEPMALDLVAKSVAAVASGLDAAHSVGIIHRDVKPSNVMVTRDGRVVLSDFGIAGLVASAEQLTQFGSVMGTPEYLAPEMASGVQASPASDQYALAVMAFELLTGRRPFGGVSALAILYAHVHEQPAPPSRLRPELPPAADAVVLRGLAKTPEQRYESCMAFAAALSQALGMPLPEHGPTRVGSTLDALIIKARELVASGDHDGAMRAVEAALKLLPGDQRLYDLQTEIQDDRRLAERYERGVRHLQAREWLAAREIFNSLYAERPDYRDVAELRKQAFAGIAQEWQKGERTARPRKPVDSKGGLVRGIAGRGEGGRAEGPAGAREGAAHGTARAEAEERRAAPVPPPLPQKSPDEEELDDLLWRFQAAKSAIASRDWRTAMAILDSLNKRLPELRDINRQIFLGLRKPRTPDEKNAPTLKEVTRLLKEGRAALDEEARTAEAAGPAGIRHYRPARFLRSALSGLLSVTRKPRRGGQEEEFEAQPAEDEQAARPAGQPPGGSPAAAGQPRAPAAGGNAAAARPSDAPAAGGNAAAGGPSDAAAAGPSEAAPPSASSGDAAAARPSDSPTADGDAGAAGASEAAAAGGDAAAAGASEAPPPSASSGDVADRRGAPPAG
ncbi:MAG: serine/threonine protein kinase [Chloroflexi bacterium]|nr:serine/threonine protein kinase [Chloroflexota bacterium]